MFLARSPRCTPREGFRPQEELGDHLSEVLRFLAVARDQEARRMLLREGLMPAVERMASSFAPASGPYGSLLEALRAYVVPPAHRRRTAPAEARS